MVIPVGEYILFKQIIDSEKGGVILPDSSQQTNGFKVVDVGDAVTRIKKGDFIAFKPSLPIAIKNEGVEKDLFLIKEGDVIARLQEL